MSRYAEQTTVSVEKSQAELQALALKYGADAFSFGWVEGLARVQFRMHGRFVRFILTCPDPRDKAFTQHPRWPWRNRAETQARKCYEQAVRQRWRALVLVVKAKLEAVETGITTFEEEFLAHIVLPDGKTVSEHALPAIATAYQNGTMPALLPGW